MLYSKPCEYGIRALVYLANSSGTAAVGAREISREENIPLPVLGKILQDLVRKGLLESRRGPGGGFFLARRSDAILLRDIVEAVDGLNHFKQCVLGLAECTEEAPCPLHFSWKDVKTRIIDDMDNTTLALMAQAAVKKQELTKKQGGSRK